MAPDLIIRNGRVIDPANGIDQVCDVSVKDGLIAAVGESIETDGDVVDFDASGCLVTPGLIDTHVHVFEHCTPLGANVDRFCLSRGTTTAVDAGSAGAGTFAGLRKFIADQSRTRVLAFLHIAAHGMAAAGCAGFGAGGECDSLKQINPDLCLKCVKDNLDMIVGIKVRLTADVCDDGKNEEEAFRRALAVGEQTCLPIMTHHSLSSVPLEATDGSLGCPGSLRAGDFYTHTFHGYPSTILAVDGETLDGSVLAARRRGVLFDLGHGQGSFSWTVAERCATLGFFPDFISTDLHSGNVDGPVYDLPTTMSKLLHLGMPLYDVIASVTASPAEALRRQTLIGSLGVGRRADVTVLRLADVDLDLEDSQGQLRRVRRLLVPEAVWKDGVQYPIIQHDVFPNKSKLASLREPWDLLVVKDALRPN